MRERPDGLEGVGGAVAVYRVDVTVATTCRGAGLGGPEVWKRSPVEAFLAERLRRAGEAVDLGGRAAHEGYAFSLCEQAGERVVCVFFFLVLLVWFLPRVSCISDGISGGISGSDSGIRRRRGKWRPDDPRPRRNQKLLVLRRDRQLRAHPVRQVLHRCADDVVVVVAVVIIVIGKGKGDWFAVVLDRDLQRAVLQCATVIFFPVFSMLMLMLMLTLLHLLSSISRHSTV